MRTRKVRRLLAMAAMAGVGTSASRAPADLQWDPLFTPVSPSGGAGAWTLVNHNWSNGAADIAWDSGNAIFGGTGGAVSIGDALSAIGLTLNVGGYTFSSANSSDILTLGGSITQSAAVIGTNTFTGPVQFNNASVNVNGGTMLFTNTNASSPNSITDTAFNVASGAMLGFSAVSGADALGSGTVQLNGGTLRLTPTAGGTVGSFNSRFTNSSVNALINNVDFNAAVLPGSPSVMSGQTGSTTTSGISFNPGYPAPASPFYAGGPSLAFSARFTGALNIAAAGDYSFQTLSDDSSKLYIDNQLVVLNNGPHSEQAVTGQAINLAAGLHEFRVDYVQGGNQSILQLNYSGPDTANAMTLVPGSAMQTLDPISMGNNVQVAQSSIIDLGGSNFTQVGFGTVTFAPAGGAPVALTVSGLTGKSLHLNAMTLSNGATNTLNNTPDVFAGALNASGTGAVLSKTGSGQLILDYTSTVNNTTGATLDVQQGRLVLIGNNAGNGGFNNPAGAATLQINGGTLSFDTKSSSVTFANSIVVTPAGGTIESQPASAIMTVGGSGTTFTLNGNIKVNTYAATIPTGTSAFAGAGLTILDPITGSGNIERVASTIAGANTDPTAGIDRGVMVLNASSPAWTGALTMDADSGATQGIFAAATDVPFGHNALTIHGGTLQLRSTNAAAITFTPNNSIVADGDFTLDVNRIGPITQQGVFQLGSLALSGSRTVTFNSAVGYGASFSSVSIGGDATFNTTAPQLTLGSVSETTPSRLIKNGAGILNLKGPANSYSGGTVINGGSLQLLGAALPSNSLTINSGTFNLEGSAQTLNNLNAPAGLARQTAVITGSSTLTLAGDINFPGNLSGSIALNIGAGRTTLSGANAYTNGTTIANGATLTVTQDLNYNVLGTGTVTLIGGTLILGGQPQLSATLRQSGLVAGFYRVAEPIGPSTNTNFIDLNTVRAHFGAMAPVLSVLTTAAGKDNFDFSNSGFASSSPFGTPSNLLGNTTANYGFPDSANFEAFFTGYINIPQAGATTFSLTSDDGSALWIDNNNLPVVNNNFFQGATTRSGSVNITTPGLHPITIGYYQGTGTSGLNVAWTPPGGSSHTLLNTEVLSGSLETAPIQTYANSFTVNASSTINVTNSLVASLGPLTLGSKLSIVSSNTTMAPYGIQFSSVTTNTIATIDVANSAGGGRGTFTTGPLHGTFAEYIKTGPGDWVVTGTSDAAGLEIIRAGRFIVSPGAILSNRVGVSSGAVLGGAGTINGSVTIAADGELSPSLEGAATANAITIQDTEFDPDPDQFNATFNVTLQSAEGVGATYDRLIFTHGISGNAKLTVNDSAYSGPLAPGGQFWIMDGSAASLPISGSLSVRFADNDLSDGSTFTDARGFTYRVNFDAPGDPMASGHDLLLTIVAVPEPASVSLLVFAGLGLLRRGRKRMSFLATSAGSDCSFSSACSRTLRS